MGKKIKIAGIATKAQGIKWFMLDNLRYAAKNGFDVHVLCEQTDIFTYENMEGITFLPQKMSRGNVSPFEVVRSVWILYKVFRKERYDIVQYTSSNAALYGSIASWFARVPVRIYCQWGISYTDYTGIKKWFYKAERLDQEIFNKAKNHPKIYFTGPIGNPAKFYAAFDFFIFPSYREGFGSVALEAAALGVPTIVSNIKGPTEFIHDGENGIICEVKSTNSLRKAMKYALTMDNKEYERLSRNCYEKVKNEFDAKLYQREFVQDRLQLYKESQKQ